MDPITLSALIGGVSGLASGFLNWGAGSSQTAQQFKYQQELQKQQNDFNLDLWNKTNAYNDPSEQVRRLASAGINPATQFGNVSEAQSIQSADPSFNMSNFNGFNLNNLASNYLQARLNEANIKMIDEERRGKQIENDNKQNLINADIAVKQSQALLNSQDIDLKSEQARLVLAQLQGQLTQNDITAKSAESMIKVAQEEARKVQNEADRAELLTLFQKIENVFAPLLKEQELKNMQALEFKTKKEAEQATATVKRIMKENEVSDHLIKQIDANTSFTSLSAEDKKRLNKAWNGLYEDRVHLELGQMRTLIENLNSRNDLQDEEKTWKFLQSISGAAASFGIGSMLMRSGTPAQAPLNAYGFQFFNSTQNPYGY